VTGVTTDGLVVGDDDAELLLQAPKASAAATISRASSDLMASYLLVFSGVPAHPRVAVV
jgi:hypothetical protein